MYKKILAGLLAVALVCGSVAVLPASEIGDSGVISVSAEDIEELTYGDYKYRVLEDNTIEITKYSGDDAELSIPTEIDGKKVTSIRIEAFAYYACENLRSVVIPNSMASIANGAFYRSSLTSITIPNSVTSIEDWAFYACRDLEKITIPDSVKSIGQDAFYYCTNLTKITIPDNVTSIDQQAFQHCESLTSITLPDGITSIESGTFYFCTSLTDVTIPNSVISIGGSAFEYCEGLTSITIPDGVTSIGRCAFFDCKNLLAAKIPASILNIGEMALGYGYKSDKYVKNDNFKIYCYPNTAGEQYAKDNEFDYTLIGDISGDGKLSTADVGKINAAVRGTKPITDETQKMLADLNGDGKITTADVGELNAYVRGTLTKW